jgi:hypothetical protein
MGITIRRTMSRAVREETSSIAISTRPNQTTRGNRVRKGRRKNRSTNSTRRRSEGDRTSCGGSKHQHPNALPNLPTPPRRIRHKRRRTSSSKQPVGTSTWHSTKNSSSARQPQRSTIIGSPSRNSSPSRPNAKISPRDHTTSRGQRWSIVIGSGLRGQERRRMSCRTWR